MLTGVVFNPTCAGCGRKMGEMSEEEFGALILAEGLEAKCLDCSPIQSELVPEVLSDIKAGQVLHFEDQDFWINRNVNGQLRLRSISHTHERERTRSCLSSSTYLNTSPKNDVLEEQHIRKTATCPDCDGWELVECSRGVKCLNCDKVWVSDELIVLPDRRADFDVVLGGMSYPPSDCPDCFALRMFRRAQYCDYHHSLLIEQHEDGSLGWSNGSL